METRSLLRLSQRLTLPRPSRHRRHPHTSSFKQANPIGDYYASLLEFSTPEIASKPPTTVSPSEQPTISRNSTDSEPAILFSSRLSSPLERRSEIRKRSTLVAGILVPPKPDEPDNCCMSGCVNCVWDRYGDELEEWAAARKEADHLLRKDKAFENERKRRKQHGGLTGLGEGTQRPEGNWGTGLETEFTSEELFKDVPVGIREFMKQEKRLKEKHAREATTE